MRVPVKKLFERFLSVGRVRNFVMLRKNVPQKLAVHVLVVDYKNPSF